MGNLRIATTRLQDFQPLAVAGQTALEAWPALRRLLLREFDAHAALLAEPIANAARGEIDWYTDGDGPATALRDLPELKRAAAQGRLDQLCEDIRMLAVRLATSRSDDERFMSDLLSLAIQVPDPDCVHMLGEQPVLVGWGQIRNGAHTGDSVLTGLARPTAPVHGAIHAPPVSPYASGPPPATWRWCALGASLLAMALVLLLLGHDPFGWFVIDVPRCRLDEGQLALAQNLQAATAREGVLRAELAQLAVTAGASRLHCPPQPSRASLPLTGDAERAHARGAQAGEVQIILAWDDRDDLDLVVICPSGMDINFARHEACGGKLDVDANSDPANLTASPVENVYFTSPAPGRYRVIVDSYSMREHEETLFRVTVRRDGQPDLVVTGVAHIGHRSQEVTEFTVAQP